jgi:hypothetical protein
MELDDIWTRDFDWGTGFGVTMLIDELGDAASPFVVQEEFVPLPDQSEPAGEERLSASSQRSAHSGLGSVMNCFRRIIHMDPTLNALIALRELFPCTGEITREHKRRKDAMAAAFEAHAAEILDRLEDPLLLFKVTSILLNSNRRVPDRQFMQFHAAKFFGTI